MAGNSTMLALSRLQEMESKAVDLESAINNLWVLVAAIMCFLLQGGFGLLEVGSVRSKNSQNIMLKNLLDACVAAIAYWAFGFAFAWGGGGSRFVGSSKFFLFDFPENHADHTYNYVFFFFQYVFAGTTATIVSGAVAERCQFSAYLIYSFVLSGFIYPIVCHWVWHADGFLFLKALDFAGGGAVHAVGGVAAFAAAYFLGPRLGRFKWDQQEQKYVSIAIRGHNMTLAAVGTFLLWFGFFAFNGASGLHMGDAESIKTTARVIVVTMMAGAAGGLTQVVCGKMYLKWWDLAFTMNGVLSGMVSVCSGCNVVDVWVGLFLGSSGSLVYFCFTLLLERLHVDDPLGASALHFGAGAWGLIMVGFFANPKYGVEKSQAGLFYGGNGNLLGWQCLFLLLLVLWTLTLCSLMFWILNRAGSFRVDRKAEIQGMDEHHHGGTAYPADHADPDEVEMEP